MFQVLRFVRRAPDIGIGRVRLLHAHLVSEAVAEHVLGHLFASAEFIDESLVEPGLINAQRGIGQQAVAIEALDIVAFESAAVAPDVDVVFLHRDHEHGARHGAADGRGVEVVDARRRDVEGARTAAPRCLRRPVACGNRSAALFPRHTASARRGISS